MAQLKQLPIKLLESSEIVVTAVFLATDEARAITGEVIGVAGGI